MTLTLYTMQKEFNSTMRPTDTQSKVVYDNVNLISPTSITRPAFSFNRGVSNSPVVYNYIKADELHRYYFIDRWEYSEGLWVAYCTVDVLATFKPVIGNSTQYVTRCQLRDGDIVDSLYPVKAIPTTTPIFGEKFFADEFDSGCFIIGVINRDDNAIASTSYYALTRRNLRSLCNQLLDIDVQYSGVTDMSEDLFKSMINPLQYFVSCTWFPFSIDELEDISLEGSTIPYGYWSYSIPNRAIFLDSIHITKSIQAIPQHPQTLMLGNFVNSLPFTRYTLVDPILGTTPLDPSIISQQGSIYFYYTIDVMSGQASCEVNAGGARPLYTVNVNIGVPINLSQATVDVIGTATSFMNAFGSGLKLNVGGIFENIGSGLENLAPAVSTKGGSGNTSIYETAPCVLCEFRELVETDPQHLGEPYCKHAQISTLLGYIKCGNAHISVACMGEELRMIEDYLNGGFYYE